MGNTKSKESAFAESAPSLLVVGSVAFDRLERGSWRERRLGGAVTYGGLTAAKLGCRVEAWSAMPAAFAALAQPRLAPLVLYATASAEPTRFVNREVPGAEREQLCPSRARPLRPEDLPFAAQARWDWIHLGPLHGEDLDVSLTSTLRRRSAILSLDLQGYTRRVDAGGSIVAEVMPDLDSRLEAVDWVKASEAEWDLVGAALGMEPSRAITHFGWRGLLVTGGAAGGVLHLPGRTIAWRAEVAGEVVLETGAGDVFTAAFVAAWLEAERHALERASEPSIDVALHRAATIAGLHVAGRWLDLDALALPVGTIVD